MLDGDITEEYAYYFERLKEILLYPNFDYQRHLDKECSNAISYFTLIQLKTLRLGKQKKIQQTLDFIVINKTIRKLTEDNLMKFTHQYKTI
jgi:hypothetical protein